MSRSNYSDDCSNWDLIKYRGRVASAIRGKRGQAFLRELLEALDNMPEKSLIADELVSDGEYCALGAIGCKRGLDMSAYDPDETDVLAKVFDIAEVLVREIVYENDEGWL